MEMPTKEEVVQALSNMSVMQVIALTRQLEEQWGVKAEPVVTQVTVEVKPQVEVQTEFNVMLMSVAADKRVAVIKAIKELTGLGLKECKDLVEAAPKSVKEGVMPEEAKAMLAKLTEAGAVVEMK